MFKSGLRSYIMPQWWRRKNSSTNTPPDNGMEVPKEFVISSLENKNKLINVSMEENEDSFVNIDYKDLTYAEAAALSVDKEESVSEAVGRTKPQMYNVSMKSMNKKDVRHDVPLDGNEILEPHRTDIKYKKSRQFKNKQHEMVQKKKAIKALGKKGRHS